MTHVIFESIGLANIFQVFPETWIASAGISFPWRWICPRLHSSRGRISCQGLSHFGSFVSFIALLFFTSFGVAKITSHFLWSRILKSPPSHCELIVSECRNVGLKIRFGSRGWHMAFQFCTGFPGASD